ncbi:uncharacterized protein LY79DRAFT_590004 [Colletotrichum navitas]|uniref:Uncharacterized protein n=1 Tax=Colletotrichum navitas TaxID=681940 RepID=A0AAD8PZZ3_9PEZI|nr:uncharacterized protein LY79DRAFT_590004 [Colletotrichum navitas]KAK1593143.1 hypothetical protein LY79DRAFT_590004 [Colletotrichum navitas]
MPQNQQRALATRTACDRCRDRQDGGACVRCARAGASCVTGAPRPLGRCRAGPSEARRRPRHSVFISAAPPRSAARASLPAASMPRGPEKPGTTALTGPSHEGPVAPSPTRDSEGSFECFHGPVVTEIPDDAVVDALDLGFPDDNDDDDATALSALFGVSDTGAFPMELEADLLEFQPHPKSLSALPGTHNPSPCVDPAFLLRSPPAGGAALDTANRLLPEQPSPGPGSNALVRLNHSRTWGALVIGIPSLTLPDSCVASVADFQDNPILQAPESTAELAAVIRQVISPVQDHGSSLSPPSMPVVLMCLSGHIQLLQIYDAIFLHVHRFLGGLHDILGFFEDLPGLTHVSGLPTIKGDLYIKMMIQVAQHNLSSVERAVALPPGLCLSAQRASSRGLLSYVDSLEPSQSIMGQAYSPSEKSGRARFASMRIRIGSILGLLRDDC